MSIQNGLKKILESIGKDNKPSYVVVAIAMAKGIFRPIFTMMDKKEKPETKKYAATREGLTEIIAIPTYLTCSYLAGQGGKLFKDPKKAKMATHNLSFVGVCTAALFVIPALCSVAIDPFTKRIFKQTKNNNVATPQKPNTQVHSNKTVTNLLNYQYSQPKNNYGMRVG